MSRYAERPRAIDYDTLITQVSHGVATPAPDIVPPVSIGSTDNPPNGDAENWKTGLDSIRSKDGERLDFALTTRAFSARARAISVQLQQQLREVGIGRLIKTSPYNVICPYDGPITPAATTSLSTATRYPGTRTARPI